MSVLEIVCSLWRLTKDFLSWFGKEARKGSVQIRQYLLATSATTALYRFHHRRTVTLEISPTLNGTQTLRNKFKCCLGVSAWQHSLLLSSSSQRTVRSNRKEIQPAVCIWFMFIFYAIAVYFKKCFSGILSKQKEAYYVKSSIMIGTTVTEKLNVTKYENEWPGSTQRRK